MAALAATLATLAPGTAPERSSPTLPRTLISSELPRQLKISSAGFSRQFQEQLREALNDPDVLQEIRKAFAEGGLKEIKVGSEGEAASYDPARERISVSTNMIISEMMQGSTLTPRGLEMLEGVLAHEGFHACSSHLMAQARALRLRYARLLLQQADREGQVPDVTPALALLVKGDLLDEAYAYLTQAGAVVAAEETRLGRALSAQDLTRVDMPGPVVGEAVSVKALPPAASLRQLLMLTPENAARLIPFVARQGHLALSDPAITYFQYYTAHALQDILTEDEGATASRGALAVDLEALKKSLTGSPAPGAGGAHRSARRAEEDPAASALAEAQAWVDAGFRPGARDLEIRTPEAIIYLITGEKGSVRVMSLPAESWAESKPGRSRGAR